MMWHERLAVILANMTVGDDTGLRPQITRELAAVIVFDDDGFTTLYQSRNDRFAMQRHEPFDLQLIGRDAFLVRQLLYRFLDHPFSGSPADQRYLSVTGTPEFGRI